MTHDAQPSQRTRGSVSGTRLLRVLIIDDSAEDRAYVRKLLVSGRETLIQLDEAETGDEGIERYRRGHADCVLLDYRLPDLDGLELLSELVTSGINVTAPIIALVGTCDDEIALEAMRRGAQDCLDKRRLSRELLDRTIGHAVERHRLQSELRLQTRRRLELQNRFLSHVSHELRSPLAVVFQFVTLVLDGVGGPTTDEQRAYLDTALRNLHQLKNMIDDLLESTRTEQGNGLVQPEVMSLGQVVQDVVDSAHDIAEEREIAFQHIIDDDLPPVWADPARVHKITLNVVDNAIKFTPRGGSVTVRTIRDPDVAGTVSVRVEDTGPGIGEANRERVFDRLYQDVSELQSSRKGLGLGLYIGRALVERQGGRIWVEPVRAGGTAVVFSLPVFSLRQLIAPVVINEGKLRDAITIVSAHVVPVGGAARSTLGTSMESDVEIAIERELVPDLDVILPPSARSSRLRSFYIVAGTDPAGATALAARLRDKLELSGLLEAADLEMTTSVRAVSMPPPGTADELDDALDHVTSEIGRAVALECEFAEAFVERRNAA